MNTRYFIFWPFRFAVIMLLGLGLLGQTACTASGREGPDFAEEDLSKIYVTPFGTAVNLQLPDTHVDAAQALTRATEQQLQEENRLQTGYGVHSLTLQGMILSYRDDVIEVQGELYDDDEFLVYSRIKRRLEPGEDWALGLDLVVEQMLDELMRKMSEVQQADYVPYYAVQPGYFVIDDRYYYGNDFYNSYYYDAYYADWGWWRHHPRRHHHDHDHDHGYQPSEPNNKPRPKPHWVSGAIFEALPRASHIHEEKNRKREEASHRHQAPASGTGFGGYWRGDADSNPERGNYRIPSPPAYQHVPETQGREPKFREQSVPSRPMPGYTPPGSHSIQHQPSVLPRPAPKNEPSLGGGSSPSRPAPSYTPPRSHQVEHESSPPPRPAPRMQSPAPAPASPSSSNHSGGASRAVPGSHKHKRD